MIGADGNETILDAGQTVAFSDKNFDVVNEFLYLGALVTPKNDQMSLVKSNRLRYTGHMIEGAEDLPQKTLFRALPEGRRNHGKPKSNWAYGVNSDSSAHGARDWTNFP
jgi:hypothetical protein